MSTQTPKALRGLPVTGRLDETYATAGWQIALPMNDSAILALVREGWHVSPNGPKHTSVFLPQQQAEATPSDEPRALTAEEMRERLLRHVRDTVEHWSSPERFFAPASRGGVETGTNTAAYMRQAAEGVAFSIMEALDGEAGDLPPFDLMPAPHPSDEGFYRGEGDNWWPAGVVINECQLHELLWRK